MSQARAEVEGQLDAVRQELRQLHQRMDAIKQEVVAEVDRQWTAMWRTAEMVDVKVRARLSGHEEYRSLVTRVREAQLREAALAAQLSRPPAG